MNVALNELLQAIERAEQIANLLESTPALAMREIAAIECRGPLLAEYNRLERSDLRKDYASTLEGLLGTLGRAYKKKEPRPYAPAIRGYCARLRQHLPAAKPVEPAGESAATRNETRQPSLDARALAVFIDHTDWSKTRIAKHLDCNEKSLAPKRCPKLAAAIAAHKAPGRKMPRGTKDRFGNIEAWRDEG